MNLHRTIVCWTNNNDYRQQFAGRWLYIDWKLRLFVHFIKIWISKWNGFAQCGTFTAKHFSIMIFLFFLSLATKDGTSNIWHRNQNTVFWIEYSSSKKKIAYVLFRVGHRISLEIMEVKKMRRLLLTLFSALTLYSTWNILILNFFTRHPIRRRLFPLSLEIRFLRKIIEARWNCVSLQALLKYFWKKLTLIKFIY